MSVAGVSEVVRQKALAAGAGAWLDALPTLVAELESEWLLQVGSVYSDSTEAFVAEATLDDGSPAVLKLIIPRPGNAARNEAQVLRLCDGVGCVRLLREDPSRDALLLERLGTPMFQLGLPLRERQERLCAAAAQLWRPVPECDLPSGAEKGRWLIGFVASTWEKLDRPCSERAVDYAISCAARRIAAHDDERAVLVHGDVHQWNALQTRSGFKLIDPDGLLAEPEYDLGIMMREDPAPLLAGDAHERSRRLAARSGLDATAIWEWGVIERVSTGLLCTEIGLQPVGREMLAVAEHVSG